MRNLQYSFICLVTLLMIASCGPDDENGLKDENTIQLNGQPFSIDNAEVRFEEGDPLGSYLNIKLEGADANGTTRTLDLWMAHSPTQPVSGSYTSTLVDSRLLDDDFTSYEVRRGVNDSDLYFLVSGSVQVQDNGSHNYTVTVNITMNEDNIFTGFFRGDIHPVE